MKYYHLQCQEHSSSNLSCFYDDEHLCLCYLFRGKRLTNCFPFNHHMQYNCFGENGGQCFQDSPNCPPCFSGRLCQLTTSDFGLSLDAILGYHITPHLSLTGQSSIVQFSLAITLIFMIIGLVDGMVCLMTFKNQSVRQVGCTIYLLASSIATLLTMTMFGLKSFILIVAQMGLISNRVFLQIQCLSLNRF